jgi:hypothetical protein
VVVEVVGGGLRPHRYKREEGGGAAGKELLATFPAARAL